MDDVSDEGTVYLQSLEFILDNHMAIILTKVKVVSVIYDCQVSVKCKILTYTDFYNDNDVVFLSLLLTFCFFLLSPFFILGRFSTQENIGFLKSDSGLNVSHVNNALQIVNFQIRKYFLNNKFL